LSAIDIVARLQEAYPHRFSPPPNSSTAISAFESGLLISPLGVEGLHQIGNSLANLRNYYSLGVRYSTLTHNCHNLYADAALIEIDQVTTVAPPLWGGISPAGRDVIKEMNRLGMIVDLSHVSVNTMRDALGGSEDWAGSAAPIMFSHSSAHSVCPHPRNVPDDILQLVKETNSVVMVNFAPQFISCVENKSSPTGVDYYPANNTIHQVVKHITYIGDLIGYEHVGLGSDFDGIDSTPEGLEDVSKFPDLVGELLKRGVSDKEASLVVGGNILRVWADVERVAQKLQKDGLKPVEDKM
jgi:membrane dipeptidase